jgi:hypothetical protein
MSALSSTHGSCPVPRSATIPYPPGPSGLGRVVVVVPEDEEEVELPGGTFRPHPVLYSTPRSVRTDCT